MKITLIRTQHSAVAKMRCGVAPFRIESDRYESLPVMARTCHVNQMEDEENIVTRSPEYVDIRDTLQILIALDGI